jgi:hypothetical protein
MATNPQSTRRVRSDDHRTFAEETATILSLLVALVLGLALGTLIILEILQILPGGLGTIVGTSLLVFAAACAKAVFDRAVAVPAVSRGLTPVVRHHGR